jgi:geranylgeranyl diphosphate synthase type I
MAAQGADDRTTAPALLEAWAPVEQELRRFLSDRRAELAAIDASAAVLVDEVVRLVDAGGKRIRPALCVWAHRAAGGSGGSPIVRAAAALELLHTFALIHDDVMDRSAERRGVPSTPAWFASHAPPGVDSRDYGVSVAILAGDLAAALAERQMRTCGASGEPLRVGLGRFDRMRAEMAAGQLLDLAGPGTGPGADRVAVLKTASYTTDGPVLVGTALAGAPPPVEEPLRRYARRLGEAFQLRDDVLDGDAGPEAADRVNALVDRAVASLDGAPLDAAGARGLAELASLLRIDAVARARGRG